MRVSTQAFCLVLFVTFSLCQPNLWAQAAEEMVLLTITDDVGNRIEVVLPNDGSMAMVVRTYEAGEILLHEKLLTGGLRVDGAAVAPFRLWFLNPGDDGTMAVYSGRESITDSSGTGTSPTGPPATSERITDSSGTGTSPTGPKSGGGE